MFDRISYISDTGATIKLKEGQEVQMNLMNLHLVFEDKDKVILGIDPGFALVGFGVVEENNGQLTALDYGVISTPKEESFSISSKFLKPYFFNKVSTLFLFSCSISNTIFFFVFG